MNAAEAAKKVAADYLGINTLERQNRDSQDFKSYNVVELKAALVAAFKLGQEFHKAEPLWYCFDKHDTFGSYSTAAEAAEQLESLARDGLTGLHMARMTEEECNTYCIDGKFPFSK